MAYKLMILLVAFLLATTGLAHGNVKGLEAVFDEFSLEGHSDYSANYVRALVDHILLPRTELATVTVTETFCDADGPTSLPDSPIFSIPETTVMTDTYAPVPVPTTKGSPISSETGNAPSDEPPAPPSPPSPSSPPAPTTSLGGQTTTLQTISSSSGSGNEGPTGASTSPTNTSAPTANAGFTQREMNSVILALALTLVRIFGV
ncbi:hypothetical protein BJY01DRAFT_216618 [Aspergillus pseudoustus]|uniref:Ser-Thr-rich glycosyl-phosphatidyl-inositol-anchored membrane family-domain-containing protein n=1 Tax=Aspergillus pseudoustus TaxID=1810923 RepID=A0ABR4JRE2_9EURO